MVKVPFPYTDRAMRQFRPALAVSTADIEATHGLLWVLMVTSADNRGWPGDVSVPRHMAVGLPAPSVIRTAKIATIDATDAIRLGRVPRGSLEQVLSRVGHTLGVHSGTSTGRGAVWLT